MAGRRVATTDSENWFDRPDTTPAPSQVVNRQKKPLLARFTKFYLWTAAILFVPMMLTMVVVGQQAIRPSDDGAVVTYGDQYSAEAQVAMEKWLAETPAPLPGGRIVSYDGSDRTTPTDDKGEELGYTLIVHHFILVDANSLLYEATLQTVLDSATGQTTLAEPGLIPLASSDPYASNDQWPWPGYDSTSASEDVQTAIKAWSTAFTSGDAAILRQAVGDPDATHFYVPLAGAKFGDDFTVTDAGAIFLDSQPKDAETPARMYVRVKFPVTWAGQNTSGTYTDATLTYDLLVDKADTATPVVVAWGAPGQSLAPYGNAITRESKVVVVTPSATPTETATPVETTTPTASPTETKK